MTPSTARTNGVALYCRTLPKAIMTGLGFSDFDMEGRYIQADYANVSVGCLLAPPGGDAGSDEQAQERVLRACCSRTSTRFATSAASS